MLPAYGSPNISSPRGCAEGFGREVREQLEKALGEEVRNLTQLCQQELEPGAWTLAGFEDLTNLVFTHTTSQSQSPNQFHR